MAKTTFGEVSWEDESFEGSDKKQTNSKDLFLRLDAGSNELRLVTKPFQYLVHKYKKEGDSGFGQKVSCSAVHGSCPLCDLQDKAKPRWLLGVISRKDNKFKILDISFAVFGQIRKLAKNTKSWGDPQKYDIDIVVDKNGGATGYYTVQPLPKEPLSAEDQKIKDEVDLDDLKRRSTPPQPDAVQARMNKINGGQTPAAPAGAAQSTPRVQSAPAAAVSMTDDEDDMDASFPAY